MAAQSGPIKIQHSYLTEVTLFICPNIESVFLNHFFYFFYLSEINIFLHDSPANNTNNQSNVWLEII